MSISELMVKQHLDKLCEEFKQLDKEVSRDSSGEALVLRSFVAQKMSELELLKNSPSVELSSEDKAQTYRQFKMAYRRAFRRWKKTLSNESRYRKTLERRVHVSSVAA